MSQAAVRIYRVPRAVTSPPVAVLTVAMSYAAVAQAGYMTSSLPGHISPIFPPAGIALAAVLILGRSALPGVWLGSFLANLIRHIPGSPSTSQVFTSLWIEGVIAVGAMAGAGVGAYLVRRLCADEYPLQSARNLFVLVVVGALVCCIISPTVGVLTLSLVGVTHWHTFGYSWLTWWLGDAAGAVLAAPLILAWLHEQPREPRPWRLLEATSLSCVLLALCYLVFFADAPLEYSLMPLLLLAAFRFDMRGATAAAAAIAILATIGTSYGTSPFASRSVNESLLLLHAFLDVNVICALFLAAVLAERKRADQALRQSEADLRRARDEAQAASQAKDHFLAAASHELRTPLTPILLLASSLEKDPTLPQDLREEIAVIREHIDLEKRLVDDLLDFTAIYAGKLQLRPRNASLHSAVQAAVDICRPEIARKHQELDLSFGAARDAVWADPDRLRQVFWNILQNAAKFTPSHGRISVQTQNDGTDRVSVIITDTGKGIDAETMSRLFLPFEQGPRTDVQHYGGLGLGLAIARAIAEGHNGTIEAASEGPGHGTTFTVRFPVAASPKPSAPADVAQGSTPELDGSLPPAEMGKRLRILLVEDHDQTRDVLTRLLSLEEHRITAVVNMAEALAAADREQFDLVLSDIGLPDGSGLELMTHLRTAHDLKGIALSGFSSKADQQAAEDAGFCEHLSKPISLGDLRQALLRVTQATG